MDSHQEYDESRLIKVIQVGNPVEANHAFGQLYEANDPLLRRFLARAKGLQEFEIDEVCATVWDRALDRIAKYVPKGIPYLAWMKKTAAYVIHERQRLQKRQDRHLAPILDDFEVEGNETWMDPLLSLLEAEEEQEAAKRREEIRQAMEHLLGQLPPDYRDVIEARHHLGLSAKETAEVLGWSQRKAYDTYYRANNRLKAMLLERYEKTEVAAWLGKSPEDLPA